MAKQDLDEAKDKAKRDLESAKKVPDAPKGEGMTKEEFRGKLKALVERLNGHRMISLAKI